MKICEELYYHSSYNPKYIQELTSVLKKTGIIPDDTVKKNLIIKNDFKNTEFYKSGLLFLNQQERCSQKDVSELPSWIKNFPYKVFLRTGLNLSQGLFEDQAKGGIETKEKNFWIKNLKSQIVKKVIYKFDFYSFSNLKKWFPNLNELDEFIIKDEYLGGIKILVSGLASQLEKLGPDDEFDILVKVIEQITSSLVSSNPYFRGSKEFKYVLLKEIISDKELNFAPNESWDKELGRSMNSIQETKFPLDLRNRPWHVFNDCFGTTEEKYFVKYIDKVYSKLKEKYDEIYLVRNERFFKLYNFEDGRALEPDYVLFLRQKMPSKNLYYQVFIEPKGAYLKEKDGWKQKFLASLKEEHKIKQLWEDQKYTVWGMPFYNHAEEKIFNDELNKLL